MLPPTSSRVARNTPPRFNERIEARTRSRVSHYAQAAPPEIEWRLADLDREWDVERALEVNAAAVSLLGLLLGATRHRAWFVLPAVVGGFLIQHALQGWCPPLPLLRRLGFRTQTEIDQERYALKALRGDFRELDALHGDPVHAARRAIEAVRR